MTEKQLKDAFHQFARNFIWGTCADCPKIDDNFYPEFCANKNRYDHKLNLAQLITQAKYHGLKTEEKE